LEITVFSFLKPVPDLVIRLIHMRREEEEEKENTPAHQSFAANDMQQICN
jgi:hypothetical protein